MDTRITFEQLKEKDRDAYVLIDIRDESAFEYGHIPGAINIPASEVAECVGRMKKEKEYYIYCKNGVASPIVVEELCENGYKAFDVAGGYVAWLRLHLKDEADGTVREKCEKSLEKKFHRSIFSKFTKAVATYKLVEENDKIAVCISGGKDSMLMAKLFQQLKKHNKFPFELVFLVMDPGYSQANSEVIERNARILGVPITVFKTDIFDSVFNIEKSPCYICARMRRGNLYAKAKELGCNKIALGHHYDDVIETVLLGMLYGGQVQTMMPKLKSNNFEGMELIRPLYLVRERDIKKWRDYNDLYFIQCACKFTDSCTSESCLIKESDNTGSKRKKVKELIAGLEKEDPEVVYNIFKSVENVNLKTIIAYKDKSGTKHNFLEDY